MRRAPPRPTLFPYTTLFRSLFDQAVVARFQADLSADHVITNRSDDNIGFLAGCALMYTGFRLEGACIQSPKFYAESRAGDRKSTRLNSSHSSISYAVFCLK